VIQFVQRFDGVSFRHAFELLKSGKLVVLSGPASGAPLKKATVPRLESPLSADAAGSASSPQADQAALRQVLDYYHERLPENPPALAYLQKRGIGDAAAIAAFRIGFVDRTLGLRLPTNQRKEGAAIRERLTRLGLLRDTGHEHLRGRIVFPVIADNGEIGTVYGRAIDERGKHDRHLFLPGPQRGIWNPAALKSSEVIITEGLIDALTFWCAGFRNVTTGYSAKALPEELLDALLAAKVQRVFLAFDRDQAGDKGTEEAAAPLLARGIECRRVLFPHGQDANDYARQVQPAAKSLGVLLNAAQWLGKGRASSESTHVHPPAPSSLAAKAASVAAPVAPWPVVLPTPSMAAKEENPLPPPAANPSGVVVLKSEPDEIELEVGDRRYRVRGLGKNAGGEALRVSLRVACGERWHLDTLDLCAARQRQSFIEAAAAETGLHAELL
jgi:DNA primase